MAIISQSCIANGPLQDLYITRIMTCLYSLFSDKGNIGIIATLSQGTSGCVTHLGRRVSTVHYLRHRRALLFVRHLKFVIRHYLYNATLQV